MSTLEMTGRETSVPLRCLKEFEHNPKKKIHGIYKAGLRSSLEYFRMRDRLKVWPDPKHKNQYFLLDGNQRIGIILSIIEDELIAEHFGISSGDDGRPDAAALRAVKSDDANDATIQSIKQRAPESQIPVIIFNDFDEEDAILFNATFNRNHAVHDEAKQVNSIDLIRSKNAELIRRMARPDKGLVAPLPRPETPLSGSVLPASSSEPYTPPADFTPSNEVEAKFGPPPSSPSPLPSPARALQTLVPLILSLTPEGHTEIMGRLLRLNARLFREKKLIEALTRLENALGDAPIDSDSIICEIALLTIDRHIAAAPQES